MIKKAFRFFIKVLGKLINREIIYYSRNKNNALGKTAVKSVVGFWYVGNVLDTADIAYGILNNGIVEKVETEFIIRILNKLLEQTKTINFYDIGANTGYYGILAAYIGKNKIRSYSFEPIKEYCNCIQESVHLNRLENSIRVFEFALGDKNSKETIHLAGSGSTLNKEFIDNKKVPYGIVEVKRLDDVVKQEELPRPDFIKIDVEGYELKVLKGGEKTIKDSLPIIFVEIAYSLKEINRKFVNKNYSQTLEFIRGFGYEILCVEGSHLVEVTDNFKPEGVRMFLCLHQTKHKLLMKYIR